MAWRRIGRIYDPERWKAVANGSHGANPSAISIGSDEIRIFFNTRDDKGRSQITSLDYSVKENRILSFDGDNIITHGERGAFDDAGCSLGSVLDTPEELTIYYLGWNLMSSVPYMDRIGLAKYNKMQNSWSKFKAPILGQSEEDPFSLSYPFVIKDGDNYRMWYGSHLTWGNTTSDKYDFVHVIKYAESKDGVHFVRDNKICISGDSKEEYAFARPSVLHEDGIFKCWYTWRGEKYRIGYAESEDGVAFHIIDKDVIPLGNGDEWDSEEVAYPFVFYYNNQKYMLYCGNGYGRTGFGIAVEE